MQAATQPKLYNPRHPERTLLHQTVAEHYETWLDLAGAGQFDGQGDHRTTKPYVRKAFAKYLECGVFAHGFASARCGDCGHDYFVAFSCKGRGVCPSCNTRRMVETAAHLTDHVLPRLPVRQWVLLVPKRLRYFLQRDGVVLNMVLRIFLRVITQSLSFAISLRCWNFSVQAARAGKRKPYLLPRGEKGPNHSQATANAPLAASAPASDTPARLPAGAAPVSGRRLAVDSAPVDHRL